MESKDVEMQPNMTTCRATIRVLAAWFFFVACGELNADLIAEWTFETSQPSLSNSTTIGSIAAESGSGTASGVHASNATDWSNPAGNGSSESFSSNNWAIGDYYQFEVATSGFFDIMVSWDQARSATGPATFDFAYSVNGGAFTTAFNDYSVPDVDSSWGSYSIDLSSVTAVDGVASLVFRLLAESAPSSTAGANRVDNFLVEATAVPEPGAALFGCLVCSVIGSVAIGKRLFAK
jgi:hypothetical protein